jgi:hypothetical protein
MTSSRAWVTDRLPTRNDADKESRVELAKYPEGDSCVQVNWKQVGTGTRWRPTKHWQDPAIPNQLPMGITKYCGICNYWSGQGKDSEGFCRRYAPHPHPATPPEKNLIAIWPATWDADWCGEWEARQ